MKRYYKKETQREMDQNYRDALRNSTPYALKQRAAKQKEAQNLAIWDGKREQRNASYRAATARVLWATRNQDRLVRVFA